MQSAVALSLRFLLVLVAGLLATGAAVAQKPNILFLLIEDQGPQVSHPAYAKFATGGLQTPNIDALINSGVAFTNAFVSTPVCSASKAAIYTGLHGHTNGIRQNTTNIEGPKTYEEDQIIAAQNSLYANGRIKEELPTLVQKLDTEGYYTGVTHKLHVAQNHQFPYDSWNTNEPTGSSFNTFVNAAGNAPWFYMANINNPHQPFATDGQTISNMAAVTTPGHIPNNTTGRSNWAKYLAAVEAADAQVGEIMQTFANRNLADDTIVVFLGDHGPGLHRGKMAPHDFGLRTVLAISGPGFEQGVVDGSLVSTVDLMPTLLDAIGATRPTLEHGQSLIPLLDGTAAGHSAAFREYVVGEVAANQQNGGGHQERSIYDGEYRLIYRHDLNAARQVNVDTWKTKNTPSSNFSYNTEAYRNIIAQRATYQNEFELLAKIHNGRFRTHPGQFELFHTAADTWEVSDLMDDPTQHAVWNRLYSALRSWAIRTNDPDTFLQTLQAEGDAVADDFTSFSLRTDDLASSPVEYTGKVGVLDDDPDWQTRVAGNGGADFTFNAGVVQAPAGNLALATHDALFVQHGQSFATSVRTQFAGTNEAAAVVFGYADAANYYRVELVNATNGVVRVVQVANGTESELHLATGRVAVDAGWNDLSIAYSADTGQLQIYAGAAGGGFTYNHNLALGELATLNGMFGLATRSGSTVKFDNFAASSTSLAGLLGDFNRNQVLDPGDIDFIVQRFGTSDGAAALVNLARPDATIDAADVAVWIESIFPLVSGYETSLGDTNLDGAIDRVDATTVLLASGTASGAGWSMGDTDFDGDVDSIDWATLLAALGPGQLPGDFNRDGTVDAADYTVWRDQLGTATLAYESADGDGNATIDAADLDIWRRAFGLSDNASTASTQGVPEPSTGVVLAIALAHAWSVLRVRIAISQRHRG